MPKARNSVACRANVMLIWSDGLDAGLGDNVTPFGRFVIDAFAHAGRAIGEHLEATFLQLLGNSWRFEDFDRFGRQKLDDRRRRFRRREKTLECVGDEILVAKFDHGRDFGQIERAVRAGDGQRLQGAGFDMGMCRRQCRKGDLRGPAQNRPRARERHILS